MNPTNGASRRFADQVDRGSAARDNAGHAGDSAAGSDDSALQELLGELRRFRRYAALLLRARIGQLRAALRNALILALLTGITLVAALAAVASAAVLIIQGAAGGLGAAFGGRAWAGQLGAGTLTLVLLATAAAMGWRMLERSHLAAARRDISTRRAHLAGHRSKEPDHAAEHRD